ncbi:MAG: DivIVA domain-containing protein [Clostridiales bacterium]|jgi:DivIVA domain-containing protein|nr:DivIVA domain-containing protein [Clostridiales bacterium]
MVLTKEAIDAVRLTKRFINSYDAREVDNLLDKIAAAVDEQCREIESLRGMQVDYEQLKDQIAGTLIMAQQTAAGMVEKTRVQCDAELGMLQQRKNTLLQELSSLERYRHHEMEKIRNDLAKILEEKPSEPNTEWTWPKTDPLARV